MTIPKVEINGVRYIPAPPECENPALLDFIYNFPDVGEVRIRDYLQALLVKLWSDPEAFKGKRPFGTSGWVFDLYKALVAADALPGKFDEDGNLEMMASSDMAQGDEIVYSLIAAMCSGA